MLCGGRLNVSNYNFSKEQCMLSEDDRVIETCGSVLSVLMYILDFLNNIYTGCPRRKGPNFGRVFLRSNYNDITQNTYIQSSMVTEILAREV